MSTWKRDVASGLVVLVPIVVTLYVVAWLYFTLANIGVLRQLVDPQLFGSSAVAGLVRVLLILLVFAALVMTVGYLMRTAIGRLLEDLLDGVINRVPGLRVVYNASKMAVETTLSGGSELQTPVKIEPWEGMRMTAFKTGKRTDDGRDVVFMPTAPNITTGFVIELDPADVEPTDERVEDALTRILSAGFGESRDRSVAIDVVDSGSAGGAAGSEGAADGGREPSSDGS